MATVLGDVELPVCSGDCEQCPDCKCTDVCAIAALEPTYSQVGKSLFVDVSDRDHAMFVESTIKMVQDESWIRRDLLARQSDEIIRTDSMLGSRRRPNRPSESQITEWTALSEQFAPLVTIFSGLIRSPQTVFDIATYVDSVRRVENMPDAMFLWVSFAAEFAADRVNTMRSTCRANILGEPCTSELGDIVRRVQVAVRTGGISPELAATAKAVGGKFAADVVLYAQIEPARMAADDSDEQSDNLVDRTIEIVKHSHDPYNAHQMTRVFIDDDVYTLTIKLVQKRTTPILVPTTALRRANCHVAVSRVNQTTVVVQRLERQAPLDVVYEQIDELMSRTGIGYYKGDVYDMFVAITSGLLGGRLGYYATGYFFTGIEAGTPIPSMQEAANGAVFNTTVTMDKMLVVTTGRDVQLLSDKACVPVQYIEKACSTTFPPNREMRIDQTALKAYKMQLSLYENAAALSVRTAIENIAFDACKTLKYLLISTEDATVSLPPCILPNLETFILSSPQGSGCQYDATVPSFVARQPKLTIAWLDTVPANGVACDSLKWPSSPLLDTILLSVNTETVERVANTLSGCKFLRRVGVYFGNGKVPHAVRETIIRNIPPNTCQFRYSRPFTGDYDHTMQQAIPGEIGYPRKQVCSSYSTLTTQTARYWTPEAHGAVGRGGEEQISMIALAIAKLAWNDTYGPTAVERICRQIAVKSHDVPAKDPTSVYYN